MSIHVLKPGLMSTIQDLGRKAQIHGISPSGAMDTLSHRIANWMVGNKDEEATLEITMIGPKLKFLCATVICLMGANLGPQLNGKEIINGRVIQIKPGDELSFHKPIKGIRTYLAVNGGIQTSPILYSRSTDVRSQIGGLHGKALQAGDKIPIFSSLLKNSAWSLSACFDNDLFFERSIRYTRGRQWEWFEQDSISTLNQTPYQITPRSNRMGIRLVGEPLKRLIQSELSTEGVAFGTIQIPPDGQPIVLMADRQTTGGYPKIGQVSSIDLPYLAQRQIGDFVTFKEVSLQQSYELLLEREKKLRILMNSLLLRSKGAISRVNYH